MSKNRTQLKNAPKTNGLIRSLFYIFVFCNQLPPNQIFSKITHDGIRTSDLRCQNQPLCQYQKFLKRNFISVLLLEFSTQSLSSPGAELFRSGLDYFVSSILSCNRRNILLIQSNESTQSSRLHHNITVT